jgi:hypothetical protein
MQSLCHRSGFAASLRDAAVHVWCNLRDGMTVHLTSQNRVRWPLPTVMVVDATNKAL